jgi:uncharacterized RDD family membrane protein YckC
MFHEVITSEKVPLTYRVAGLGSRFLAAVIDLGLLLLLLIVGVLIASVLDVARQGLGIAIVFVWVFVLQFGYFTLFEWLWLGQTPGKNALGIRVIAWQGGSISFGQSALRNIVRIADILPGGYGVAFLVAASNREQRRLGDLAAGTLVVHQERSVGAIRALHGALSGEAQAREAQFRQRLEQLDRRQKQTVLDLCLRRDQMRIRTRTRLFRALADYFKTELGLTPLAYESDEKFVLQLATLIGGVGASGPALVAGLRAVAPGKGPHMRSEDGKEDLTP